MAFDFCVIGHITRDMIEISGSPVRVQPGGTVYYSSLTASRLGLRTVAVSKLNRRDRSLLLEEMEASGISLRVFDSPSTTEFVNSFSSENFDDRDQKVLSVADPFGPHEIDVEAEVYVFGPLTHGELPIECVERAAAKGRPVAMDLQGLLRYVRGQRVELEPSGEALRMLRHVDILKASHDEAGLLTGERSIEGAARALAAAGPREVLVTSGSRGSHVFAGGELFEIQAYAPPKVVDSTGCGDTYLAAYLTGRLRGDSPEEAGHFASRVAGAKTASHGAYRGGVKAVRPVVAADVAVSTWV